MDFNPTCFSHPKAADGFTLSIADKGIREFWIEHGIACRRIGAAIGKALGSPCVTNVWIPDGYKDTPVDRGGPRERLAESLDAVFAEKLDPQHNLDAVESKLFGIGSESYVVGSHEFYLGYAISRQEAACLDAGHFHPTETIADKLSRSCCSLPGDPAARQPRRPLGQRPRGGPRPTSCEAIAQELVRGDYLGRTHIGLDYFDASINRVAAWVIGTRNMLKALLMALLEPTARLRELRGAGDYTARLALLEEIKTLPVGRRVGSLLRDRRRAWRGAMAARDQGYERTVLSARTNVEPSDVGTASVPCTSC